jgi:acyl carrier protein
MERPISVSAVRDTIFKALKKIAPEANPQDVAPGENLREALDIDSFDFLNLLIGLHESLGVEIPETDYGKLTTLNGLVSYLSQRVG